MARTIDISSKLTNERPKLKLGEGKEFEIDNSKNTVLVLNQKMEQSNLNDPAEIDAIFELLLGKEAVEEINKLNPPMTDLIAIFIGVMAGATGEEYETVERRFRRAAEE